MNKVILHNFFLISPIEEIVSMHVWDGPYNNQTYNMLYIKLRYIMNHFLNQMKYYKTCGYIYIYKLLNNFNALSEWCQYTDMMC